MTRDALAQSIRKRTKSAFFLHYNVYNEHGITDADFAAAFEISPIQADRYRKGVETLPDYMLATCEAALSRYNRHYGNLSFLKCLRTEAALAMNEKLILAFG